MSEPGIAKLGLPARPGDHSTVPNTNQRSSTPSQERFLDLINDDPKWMGIAYALPDETLTDVLRHCGAVCPAKWY